MALSMISQAIAVLYAYRQQKPSNEDVGLFSLFRSVMVLNREEGWTGMACLSVLCLSGWKREN